MITIHMFLFECFCLYVCINSEEENGGVYWSPEAVEVCIDFVFIENLGDCEKKNQLYSIISFKIRSIFTCYIIKLIEKLS